MAKVSEAKITDFQPDPDNANLGTEFGQATIEQSVRECGAARSIVVDADNVIAAGSKTLQAAVDAGLEKAVVVEVEGDELVVVRRKDFRLAEGGLARRYAYLDNLSSERNLLFDGAQILADMDAGIDLDGLFTDIELERLLANMDEQKSSDHKESPQTEETEFEVTCPQCGFEFVPDYG